MIKSMTGYGRAERIYGEKSIVVEAKSVNHRFLEIFLRTPSALFPLELEYKKKITERFKRGRLEVFIKLDGDSSEASKVNLNLDVARDYYSALSRMNEELNLQSPVDLKTLVCFRDIFSPPAESPLTPEFLGEVEKTLQQALEILAGMRREEGILLFQDMQMRLHEIEQILAKIGSRAPCVVSEYQKRLSERVKELTDGLVVDESRLAQEVAIMAERTDITEEIVRMKSHISQFESLLQSEGTEGKKIDFLLQEMNREINTIGSKTGDVDIVRCVIEVKSELSKLREQAQNIE